METLQVALGRHSYPIYIGGGLLEQAEELLRPLGVGRWAIVCDDTVADLYGAPLARRTGWPLVTFPAGEGSKSLEEYGRLCRRLVQLGLTRSDGIVALGGGVTGDLAGFAAATLLIIYAGVRNGIERVSKLMMPILVVLSVLIAGYSVTRPGALAGVKYFLVPNFENFSWMTVVTAMGQMFYSLSIAMGILITFGSYMKKSVSIEGSTETVEIFDTAIAVMAGLMIIPAIFAFSGGDPNMLQAGPSLMFITIPKVFDSMGLGSAVGILFFMLVLFAAMTSSIALTESAVSTFQDELGWSRHKATLMMGVVMLLLGSLSSLSYGPLANVTILGMQLLDFFDFLTNSVMMPIAAIAVCLLVSRVAGVKAVEQEVCHGEERFRRKRVFNLMIRYLCPLFAAIILVSAIANAFGWIRM